MAKFRIFKLLLLLLAAHIGAVSCKVERQAVGKFNGSTPTDEVISTILYKTSDLHNQITVADYIHLSSAVNTKLTPTSDRFIHSYADDGDLDMYKGPAVDHEQCLAQLEALQDRVDLLNEDPMGQSGDLNLAELLDTWGRQPSGMLLGNYLWLGSYNQCKRLKIKFDPLHLGTRYCLASLNLYGLPQSGDSAQASASVGLCLPETCDSKPEKDKLKLIEKLLHSVQPNLPLEANVTLLYCLPDEQSPARKWSSEALVLMSLTGAWLSLLIYSTYTNRFPKLSISHNFKLLFEPSSRENTEQAVDLECLGGIRVIAIMVVISGHLMIFSELRVNNMRELASVSLQSMAHHWANMIPPLAVNVLFALAAIQLAYTSFRSASGSSLPLLSRPKRCLSLIWNQYLRVMPYYVLVVAYAKYLAKYTGSGPLWDYGTAPTSLRRSCEQESWWTTFTFGVIFKYPPEHCLPFAWYLANEFIFVSLTPILFSLIHWRPKMGQNILMGSILGSFLLNSIKIFSLKDADLRPVTSFMPHGPRLVMTLMADLYALPQYRAPAYLVGLLIGYKLYQYEEQVRSKKMDKPPTWLKLAKSNGLSFVLFWFFIGLAWPSIASLLGAGRNKRLAHRLLCFFYPFSHLIAGLIFSIALVVASTARDTNDTHRWLKDLLSASLWRPLAKLCLPVTLLSIEVVHYFTQTSQRLFYGDFKLIMSLSLSLIVTVHLLAALFHLLFEAPIKSLLSFLTLDEQDENKRKQN